MEEAPSEIPEFSPALIKLLKGPIYCHEIDTWDLTLRYQTTIRDYFAYLGLQLHVDEADGFAYLRQKDYQEDEKKLPHLIRKIPLSREVTLLCVLLRDQLQQFDLTDPDLTRLILSQDDLREMLKVFYPEQTNEIQLVRNVDATIKKCVDLGFLTPLSTDDTHYEVRRILKAQISAETLQEIKERFYATC